MKDKISVSTATLADCVEQLKALAAEWGDETAPSSKVDTRASEDEINLQSEGKTIEELKDQALAARRAKKTFINLIQATAQYLGGTKEAFNKADNN